MGGKNLKDTKPHSYHPCLQWHSCGVLSVINICLKQCFKTRKQKKRTLHITMDVWCIHASNYKEHSQSCSACPGTGHATFAGSVRAGSRGVPVEHKELPRVGLRFYFSRNIAPSQSMVRDSQPAVTPNPIYFALLSLGHVGRSSPCESLTANLINQSEGAQHSNSAISGNIIFPHFWERCSR